MADGIRIEIENYDTVLREIAICQRDVAGSASRALTDVGTKQVKTAVQQNVRKVYNVQVADVNDIFHYRETGSVNVAGVSIPFFEDEWEQKRSFTIAHTPFRLKMSGRGKNKRPEWKPLKAKGHIPVKSETGYPVFLQTAKGSPLLPWNRKQAETWRNGGRLPFDLIPSHLSVPQMIDNEKVRPLIERDIDQRLEKALRKALPRWAR